MTWWQSAVLALAGALIGTGIPAAVALAVFRAGVRKDRDLQWRTERRDLYAAVVDAAQAFVLAGQQWIHATHLARHHFGNPAVTGPDVEKALDAAVAAREHLETAVSRLAMIAPTQVVELGRLLLEPTRADPTQQRLAGMQLLMNEFANAGRRDIGLDDLPMPDIEVRLWPPDPPPLGAPPAPSPDVQ